MAGSGSLINYSNIKSLLGSSWRSSVTVGYTGTYTYYVTAPAFHIDYWIKGSGWWGYQEGSIYVYRWNGSNFSTCVYSGSNSCRGSKNQISWAFSHNYNGGSSGDVHNCQLWKIVVYSGNNDGSSGGTLYTGGLGLVSESLYNSYFKNKLIYCSKGTYWTSSTYNDSTFISNQGYSCMRGTKISVSSGTYQYVTAQ